jgi:hypothetical protein
MSSPVIRGSNAWAPWVWIISLFVSVACSGATSAQAEAAEAAPMPTPKDNLHPLDPALEIARDSLEHIQSNVHDYTAIMTKRCRVDGELSPYQQAFVKIRNRRIDGDRAVPMSVYLKFRRPDSIKGREVIWVEGRNGGKMIAHDTGLKSLISVSLDPHGTIAMRGQRYPITEIGLEKLAQKLIEKGERDRQFGECQVKFFDRATVNKRTCRMFQIDHPVERPHFEFHRAQVFFDDQLRMPVRYASWSWPLEHGGEPVLEEEYMYTDVQVNQGLTDFDFDPGNPAYNF